MQCNAMQFNIMSFNSDSDSDSDSNSNPNSDSLSIYFDLERRSKKKGTAAPPTRERKDATPPKERGKAAPTNYII